MSDIAIRAENISKLYCIGNSEPYRALRDVLTDTLYAPFRWFRNPQSASESRSGCNPQSAKDFIWALKDISFEVRCGEVVGIIGRNGAGKSTLLKIFSRVTEPTEGYARICGRVGSLLEVGTGFHPELSGRENIYLNGTILGMKRSEINRKFDEIVAFAEVERFIDTPVKHYSSGMGMRLAFAVAAHLEPEVLLVDEVLAVGDVAFQKKCIGKMGDVAKEGRTILFVSHNMGAITKLCSRAILLDQGQYLAGGEVSGVLEAYLQLNNKNGAQIPSSSDHSLPCSIVDLKLYNKDGIEDTSFDIGEDIIISITYRVTTKLQGLQITATLSRNMVDVVHSFDTDGSDEIPLRGPGLYQARYTIPKMFLKAGIYSVRITTGTPDRLIQNIESALRFEADEISVNTHMKGYRRDRPGHVISPGRWQTIRLE